MHTIKRRFVVTVLATVVGLSGKALSAAEIEVPSVLLKLIEQADVPAREAGQMIEVKVKEGQQVAIGDELARIDDAESQLAKTRAQLDLDAAKLKSENNVEVRFAKKAHEVAQAEYRRAAESVERFPKSISQTELDRLRLSAEQAELAIEKAQRELELAKLAVKSKENELAAANRAVERRKIPAPIAGVVVQINRRQGEWVEPGEKVFRVVRIDKLRAEAFVNAKDVRGDLRGATVTLTVDLADRAGAKLPGRIVFVSPEIDPVNRQVRIVAEIDNRDRLLKPGLRGTMTVSE